MWQPGNQVASSMVLQMIIYFNVYLSVIWAIFFILLFQWKESPADSLSLCP